MKITNKQITSYRGYDKARKMHEKELESPYTKSRFKIIKDLGSYNKAKILKEILTEEIRKNRITIEWLERGKYAKIITNDGTVYIAAVKSSFLWGAKGEGGMRWQQIRVNEEYNMVIFIAVFPDRIEFYYGHRTEIVSSEKLVAQHSRETRLIHGDPESFEFMKPLSNLFINKQRAVA